MVKPNNRKTAIILYFGVSIQTTPKVSLIKRTLEKKFENVIIAGVTARAYTSEANHKVIAIESKSKIKKVMLSIIAITKICNWINKSNPDLVYAINPIPGFISAAFKKAKSITYLYETLEIFGGIDYFPYNKRYRNLWYHIEKIAIQNSEMSFTTDEFRLKLLRRYFKIKNEKIKFTYNTREIAETSNKTKPQKLVLSYCGGVYPGRQIEEIIHAFSLLKETHPTAKLIIAGGGPPEYLRKISALASNLMISTSVEITGHLANEELKDIMSDSIITFAFYKGDSLNNRLNSPNKIFDSIFSRTALITTSSPLSRKIIASNHIGETINNTNPADILDRCLKILSTPPEKSEFDALMRKYCWESEEEKILQALPPT